MGFISLTAAFPAEFLARWVIGGKGLSFKQLTVTECCPAPVERILIHLLDGGNRYALSEHRNDANWNQYLDLTISNPARRS